MGYYLSGLRFFIVDFLSYPNFVGEMPHQVLNSTGEIREQPIVVWVKTQVSGTAGHLFHHREERRELSWCPNVIDDVCSRLRVSIDYSLYAITWGSDKPEEYKELQETGSLLSYDCHTKRIL